MTDNDLKLTSLIARGARHHFAVGIALTAVVPLLVLCYLTSRVFLDIDESGRMGLVLCGITFVIGLLGYTVLRKYPRSVMRLRDYTEQMAEGELPDHIALPQTESDIAAIEKYMGRIVGRLREKVDALEVEKEMLEKRLYQAQKMESLGLMAGGLAQEFDGVLAGIREQLDLAVEAVADGIPVSSCLDEIDQRVKKGKVLAEQMLVYTGEGEVELEDVDLASAAGEMVQLLRSCVLKTAEMACDLPPGLPPVRADATQIQQVVTNLVLNASDAMQGEQGTITVTAGQRDYEESDLAGSYPPGRAQAGRYVFLEVSDTGRGMSHEAGARILDPFFSTKSGARGVGLAVVLGVVRAHNGLLMIDSEPGRGSTFRVLFPPAASTGGALRPPSA